MNDAGEALVDAEARLQERMEEREAERRRRGGRASLLEPRKARELESLKLARKELQRQAAATANALRRTQIDAAIGEIDRRLASAVAS
jgi:hypothetical protein